MDTSKAKKTLSLVLALIMLFTMIPSAIFTLASEGSYPVMKAYTSLPVNNLPDHHTYRSSIVTVTFTDEIDTNSATASWDISASAETGTVMSWIKLNETETAAAGADRYDLYIGGEGGVATNQNSTNVFYSFKALKAVYGLENLDTSNSTRLDCFFEECSSLTALDLRAFETSACTDFSYMFSGCKALESINLTGWDTSKAKNMSFMFANCWVLPVLDISGFDTRSVTNMKRMFYKCEKLTSLYMGDNWSVEQVSESNSGEMFNCCYAIKGKKTYNEVPSPYNKQYATTDYFLTYKAPLAPADYTVTYEFVGDIIPEGVTAPDSAVYEEGTNVNVADKPSADGYVFSGWSTEDTTVTDNSFTINNDVHFVGSWKKLYKVEYRYADGYPVPEGAPQLPEAQYYTADEWVDVLGVHYINRHVFIGWTSEDADVSGDMFVMPHNDVVLYGYYKIPVESIEIMMNEDIVINKDEKTRINVYVNPEDATIKDIIYESNDESVVKIDKYGNITAVGEGTATVTVYSKDDTSKKDEITVTVKSPVTELTVDKTEITLNKGDEDKITAEVNPEATNRKITYKSNDEKIVTVDENGNIKAVGEGVAIITVYSEDDPTVKKDVTVTVKIPVTELTVENKEITLDIDEIKSINAKVNEDATDKELIYESSDPGIAKVDSNGDIIAVGKGEAIITVTSRDNPSKTETVKVTVEIPVEDIITDRNEINLEVGQTDKVTVTVTPDDATDKSVTYESNDESVVKVDENGNIEAVGEGEAIITITSKDDHTKTETVKVTVKNPVVPVDGIKVNKTEIELEEGKTDKITVTVTPDNATDKGVTFESSDETVVKVDENGNVIAVGEGEATVTVTSDDNPDLFIKIPVRVTVPEKPTEPEKIPVDEVIVDKYDIFLEKGDTDKITASVKPDDATEKGVTYKSVNESIVKVDENGNIEAVGEGTTTILIISKDDPTKVATVFVTVNPVYVPADGIVTDRDEITLTKGETDKITVSVTPENATEKGVTYESSNENVIKVDKKGNITAVGEGEAVITVISKDDPTKKVTVKITVEKPVYTIEVPSGINMYKGETAPIGVVITPDDGTVVPVYKSSDESVVTIDADGNLKAVGIGIAVITADFGGGDIRLIPVTVLTVPVKHHVCFGKTDGIGWYEVSVNGGDFFPQGPNSTLEVEEGSILVVRVQDMWIDDEFDFYVNGKKVPLDPANTITVVVDGYMLIGALSMDVPVPDAEESLNLFQRLLKAITDFFAMIKSWFTGK